MCIRDRRNVALRLPIEGCCSHFSQKAQIDLEKFTESDVEQEVQILIETSQNMDPDPAETEKENNHISYDNGSLFKIIPSV